MTVPNPKLGWRPAQECEGYGGSLGGLCSTTADHSESLAVSQPASYGPVTAKLVVVMVVAAAAAARVCDRRSINHST